MVRFIPSRKREVRSLTGYCVSVHVIEDVPKTEDPGGSSRCAASEQRGAEFLARSARVKVRGGFQSGAHASRQRAHLIRTAAAFDLASIALHAHFLAVEIQRRTKRGRMERKTHGPHSSDGLGGLSVEISRSEIVVWSVEAQKPLFAGSYFCTSVRWRTGCAFLSFFFFFVSTKCCSVEGVGGWGAWPGCKKTPPLKACSEWWSRTWHCAVDAQSFGTVRWQCWGIGVSAYSVIYIYLIYKGPMTDWENISLLLILLNNHRLIEVGHLKCVAQTHLDIRGSYWTVPGVSMVCLWIYVCRPLHKSEIYNVLLMIQLYNKKYMSLHCAILTTPEQIQSYLETVSFSLQMFLIV